MPVFQPLIKIYPNKISVFYFNHEKRIYPANQGENLAKDRSKRFQGILSNSGKRLIEERLSCWFFIVDAYNVMTKILGLKERKRLVFLTLTLSSKQIHDDMFIKEKLLEMFLKSLKQEFGLRNYFWKAEVQENGNLHFHMVIDIYIDKERLTEIWNEVQDYYGYLNDYKKKYKKDNPPSTHIEAIDSKQDAISYVMKYVSKKVTTRMVQGRLWSMSKTIESLRIPTLEMDSYFEGFLNDLKKYNTVKIYNEEYFSILRFDKGINIFKSNYYNCENLIDYYNHLANCLYLQDISDDTFVNIVSSYFPKVDRTPKVVAESLVIEPSPPPQQLSLLLISARSSF